MAWSANDILALIQLLVAAWQICKYTPLVILVKSGLSYLLGLAVLRPLGRLLENPYVYVRKFVDDKGVHLSSWHPWNVDQYVEDISVDEMEYRSMQGAGKISFSAREWGGIIKHAHNRKTRVYSVTNKDDYLRCLSILTYINKNRYFIHKKSDFMSGIQTAVVLSVPELVRLAVMENKFNCKESWGKFIYVNDVKQSDEKILQTLSVAGLWFTLKHYSTLSLVATSTYIVLDRLGPARKKIYDWASLVSSILFNNIYFALSFKKRAWLSKTLKPWWSDGAPGNPLKRCLDVRVGMKFISIGKMRGCGSVQELQLEDDQVYQATGQSRVYSCQHVNLFIFKTGDIHSSAAHGINFDQVSFARQAGGVDGNMVAGMADKDGNVLEYRTMCLIWGDLRFQQVDALFHYISRHNMTPIYSVEDHGIFKLARSMPFDHVLSSFEQDSPIIMAKWQLVKGLVLVS